MTVFGGNNGSTIISLPFLIVLFVKVTAMPNLSCVPFFSRVSAKVTKRKNPPFCKPKKKR